MNLEARDLVVIDEDAPWRPPEPDASLLGLKNMWFDQFHDAQSKLNDALSDMASWRLRALKAERTLELVGLAWSGEHSIFED